jgi:ABC-2 type transport system ATP-binding protein
VLLVRGHGLARAAGAVRGERGVLGVESFGAGLHVRLEPAASGPAQLAAALAAAGASDVEVEEGEPSLEDVFLAVVGRTGSGAEAKP